MCSYLRSIWRPFMEARDLFFGEDEYGDEVPKFESVTDAKKYLNECFIRGTFIDITPNDSGYDILLEGLSRAHQIPRARRRGCAEHHKLGL